MKQPRPSCLWRAHAATFTANPVVKRIREMGSVQSRAKRQIIRKVVWREHICGMRHSWALFERNTDRVPLEVIELNVTFEEALSIEREIDEELRFTICARQTTFKPGRPEGTA